MDKTREFVLEYGEGGLCGVRLYEGEGEKPVVVASEPPEDCGYVGPSITNSIEYIAGALVTSLEALRAAVERASEEDLAGEGAPPFVVVEHYRHVPGSGARMSDSPRPDETFDLVTFEDYHTRASGRYVALGEPDWAHVSREAVEHLIGGELEEGGWLVELGEKLPAAGEVSEGEEVREEARADTKPPIAWDSDRGDIILRRRGGPGEVETNVRWSVAHHSPSGYEWGYSGSGPADLALNILAMFLPVGQDGAEAVECFRGEVSLAAFELHQRFKEEFIATMDREGGVIEGAMIRHWIFCRTISAGGRIIVPSNGRLPEEGRA